MVSTEVFYMKYDIHGYSSKEDLIKECKDLIKKSNALSKKVDDKIKLLEKKKLH